MFVLENQFFYTICFTFTYVLNTLCNHCYTVQCCYHLAFLFRNSVTSCFHRTIMFERCIYFQFTVMFALFSNVFTVQSCLQITLSFTHQVTSYNHGSTLWFLWLWTTKQVYEHNNII